MSYNCFAFLNYIIISELLGSITSSNSVFPDHMTIEVPGSTLLSICSLSSTHTDLLELNQHVVLTESLIGCYTADACLGSCYFASNLSDIVK